MIYKGILWFCCLYISNIWWKFTSVNWGPSIAIRISLPIDVTNSRPETILIKWVWFQQKWVWPNKRVALLPKLFPPPQKIILYEILGVSVNQQDRGMSVNEQDRGVSVNEQDRGVSVNEQDRGVSVNEQDRGIVKCWLAAEVNTELKLHNVM